EDQIASTIAAIPDSGDADQEEDTATVASLPETMPVSADAFPTSPAEIIPAAKTPAEEVLAYAAPATPKLALVSRKPGTDPTAAVVPAVKTTPKGARPTRKDLKKAVQPMVIAAQPADARWALDNSLLNSKIKSMSAPSVAYNLVRSSPSEVYTAGFQQDT